MAGDPASDDAIAFPDLPRGPVITASLPPRGQPENAAAQDRLHRINGRLAVGLVVLIALSPVPFGSNRPVFWTISALLIGCTCLWYGLRLYGWRATPRFALRDLMVESTLFVVFCIALWVQTLPLGGLVPPFPIFERLGLEAQRLSLAPGETALMLTRQVGYGLFFFVATQVAVNRRRARRMLFAILVLIAIHALVGLLSLTQWGDTVLGFAKTQYQGFATGTFINRNSYATFLAAGLAIATALLFDASSEGRNVRLSPARVLTVVAIVASMLVMGATLFATGSRMGSFAAAAGVVVALAIGTWVSPNRRALIWVVPVAIAGVALLLAYGTGLLERAITLSSSAESRGELYHQIWEMIFERPWLGYGGGSFPLVFPAFQHPPLEGQGVWDRAHSTYLALWSEMGLIVGSIPMIVVGLLTLRSARTVTEPSSRATGIAAVATVTVFAVHATVDFSLEIQANTYLFLAVLGIGTAGRAIRFSSVLKAAA